jgi:NAD(P)H-hydrate epimerase
VRPVPTAAEARALDAATIGELGLPGAILMEHAGRAVAAAVLDELAAGAPGPVAILAGPGNNGGDGHVAARWLGEVGVAATVYLLGRAAAVAGDAALHLEAWRRRGGAVIELGDAAAVAAHAGAIAAAGVVVDAIYGTGLGRDIDGVARAVIERVNAGGARVVAVDLPSGLDADRGVARGIAMRADRTVALGFAKPAHVGAPGFARCGAVEVAAIGIPTRLAFERGVRLGVVEPADLIDLVPRRAADAHKGHAGHVLVVAGSPGKRGAGRLAAAAALRGGAGLATLAGIGGELAAADPVMTDGLPAAPAAAAARVVELAEGKGALAIGPGLGTEPGARALVDAALELATPRVIDADGLNLLVDRLGEVAAAAGRGPLVLTPHPGEAARLLATTVAEVEADRVGAARRLADATRAVVVLKGARTIVVDGAGGFATINPTGGPALATAGTGDVLAGVIAGLLAQGLAPADAARLGAWVHGTAGELAAQEIGAVGVTASDVLERVPAGFARLTAEPRLQRQR